MRKVVGAAVFFGALFVLGCGGGGPSYPPPTGGGGGGGGDGGTNQAVIMISNFTFIPGNLTVSAGATVTVQNEDSVPHSVTSESTPGSFTPGGVSGVSFDTGPFTGTATFTIPSTAPSGTIIPYYCSVHRGAMKNSPTITIK